MHAVCVSICLLQVLVAVLEHTPSSLELVEVQEQLVR